MLVLLKHHKDEFHGWEGSRTDQASLYSAALSQFNSTPTISLLSFSFLPSVLSSFHSSFLPFLFLPSSFVPSFLPFVFPCLVNSVIFSFHHSGFPYFPYLLYILPSGLSFFLTFFLYSFLPSLSLFFLPSFILLFLPSILLLAFFTVFLL